MISTAFCAVTDLTTVHLLRTHKKVTMQNRHMKTTKSLAVINNIRMYIFCISVSVVGHSLAVAPELKIPRPDTEHNVSYDYYAQLLHKVLKKGADGRPVPLLKETLLMEQERRVYELLRGDTVDIDWLGSDDFKEKNLRVIPIPVEGGLMGYRRFIVRKDMVAEFDKVKTLDDLKKFTACQSRHWPDYKILTAAGLKVTGGVGYENQFKQVAAHRCDYFPRGYHEIATELKLYQEKYPTLTGYDGIILHYPFTVYFFVNKKNEELAQWIESGLEKMINDGDLLAHMREHPLTAHVFSNKMRQDVRVIEIPNPLLLETTDHQNPRYWFQSHEVVQGFSPH